MSALIYYFQEYLCHEWSIFRNPKKKEYDILRREPRSFQDPTDAEKGESDRKHGRYLRLASMVLSKHFIPLVEAQKEAMKTKKPINDNEPEDQDDDEEVPISSPEITTSRNRIESITFGETTDYGSKKKRTRNSSSKS